MTSAAVMFQALGLKHGFGGIVQSIESLKVTWQTSIIIILSGGQKMPSLTQFAGMFYGVLGGIIIVLNKPKSKPVEAVQRFSLLDEHLNKIDSVSSEPILKKTSD
jgi:hypothetical protein